MIIVGQVEREAFLDAIVLYLRTTNGSAVANGAEEMFYDAKQRLLDDHQSGPSDVRVIASIGWDEVQQRLEVAGRNA